METIKKIVAIGPESTGKSTLCKKLAAHFNTLWVPEYARQYLENNGTAYNYDDLLTIAKGQIDLEERISAQLTTHHSQPSTLLIDTDMNVIKVWAEFVFNKCHNWVLNRIAERKYDAYLLCDIDLPWVEDSLREYPDHEVRAKLFQFYKDIMVHQASPWCHISGDYEERFEKAVRFIENSLQ